MLGDKMLVDVTEQTVKHYQDVRLRENTAPKSINEEVGFLLRRMDTAGDVLRVRLRKKNLLKLKTRARIAKPFTPEEKTRLIRVKYFSVRGQLFFPIVRCAEAEHGFFLF
jgi:hypothetical protein